MPTVDRRGRWLVSVAALCGLLGLVSLAPPPGPALAPPVEVSEIAWLEKQSMLYQARQAATSVSGRSVQWRHPYGKPMPKKAIRNASVWLLDYPGSVIAGSGKSVIATWAEPGLWDSLHQLGIELLHTGPLNRSGGVVGKKWTPTLDGWFDRSSLDLDPELGSEKDYARMVAVARKRDSSIAGDLVPLHTGPGPDFHLALRAYKDYPGMYTMVEIASQDWGLLPPSRGAWKFDLIPQNAARELTHKGYLPGLINSNDAASGAKSWSGWSASGEVPGADGKVRRWAYLHYFKPSQPALNWLDPSFAANRAIGGDVVRTVQQRGTRIVRLDAVPFLGIEPKPGTTETLHYQHPLSVVGTNQLAMLIRKLGGFSFQELNVPLVSLQKYTYNGPDLSYDFFTRAQYLYALLSEDAGPLRLSFRWLLDADVQPVTLVHDLQNHDEITFQLVEPDFRKHETFTLNGKKITGQQLREKMLDEMRARVGGKAAPYNKLYRPEKDGIATTFVGFIAPALGVADPYHATAEQIDLIRRGHLLVAAVNALQPGVFSLSSWDLVGALPVPLDEVKARTGEGDYRWINRGGVDLLGANPRATESVFGMPRAKALYGSLPEQLASPRSFASQLRQLLTVRRQTRLAEGELLAVLEPRSPSLCVLALKTPEYPLALSVVNFSRKSVEEELAIDKIRGHKVATNQPWHDLLRGTAMGSVDDKGRLKFRLPGLSAALLVPQQGKR